MKKILSVLLTFSLLFCFFACKEKESEENDALQIYSEAQNLTKNLAYQKFDLSRRVTNRSDDSEYSEPYSLFVKLIKDGENTSFYSERMLKINTEAGTTAAFLLHHYKNGVMYQTLESGKMKHALSLSDFEKKYPALDVIILNLPASENLSFTKIADNEDGGSDYSLSIDTSLLAGSEVEKLGQIFDAYSSHNLSDSYSVSGVVDIKFSTDFYGYFVRYSLSFNVSGEENGELKDLSMSLSLDIYNPGSHFIMNELSNASSYTEGTLDIK